MAERHRHLEGIGHLGLPGPKRSWVFDCIMGFWRGLGGVAKGTSENALVLLMVQLDQPVKYESLWKS